MVADEERQVVELRQVGGIAIISFNMPERRNAFGLQMRTQFQNKLDSVSKAPDIRAIIITGKEQYFTCGGDIKELHRRSISEARERVEQLTAIFKSIVKSPKPVITAIEGDCMGVGVSFAAASDIAIASEDARFGCAFIKVGLIPDMGGIWSIPKKIGYRKAFELAAFGDQFSARDALRYELINEVVEAGMTLDRAMKVGERFTHMPPLAIAQLKTALYAGGESIDERCRSEINLQSVLMNSSDHAEAANAFLEKREPNFVGE